MLHAPCKIDCSIHLDLQCVQAIEASTQSPLEEVRKPAEQLLKACEELPGYTSVLAAIATTHAAPTDARATAVILLKNMVR